MKCGSVPARDRGSGRLRSSDTSRPHGAAGYQRNARNEQDCFGPRQYPIATHAAPQSLDCPG